jgi:hypothetical protein
MRHKWKIAAGGGLVAVAVAVLTAALGGSAKQHVGAGAASHELSALAGSGEAARHFDRQIVTAASFGPNVREGVFQGVSPAVSDLPTALVGPIDQLQARDFENLAKNPQTVNAKDPVVQAKAGKGSGTTAPIANFDGQCSPAADTPCPTNLASSCGCLPPDTNGEVGNTQYVQMVNSNFAVFSKTGAVLRGATDINKLWTNASGECKTHNDGDPVVVYDQLAQRWLLTQFVALPSGDAGDDQYAECIAVSTTSDATGTYYLYEFDFGNTTFFDYPKLGVWPDAYYMSANAFDGLTGVGTGSGAFAFERSAMLQGKPARVVFFDESNTSGVPGLPYYGQLPSDLDGLRPPPPGTPNVFSEVDDPNTVPDPANPFAMHLWKFHVDWANPQSSTFGKAGAPSYTLPVEPFIRPQCVYGYGPNCNPQFSGPQDLDTLGDRLMFRLAYRNFGNGGESLVLNHTVSANGPNGIRWYEVRNPAGRNGQKPTIYQQSTYAPSDTLWRWMGSIAMDKSGDIALGYSASSPTDYPSVRYTGRLASDPPGSMTQAEQNAFTGQGPQTQAEGRWGDYSDLTVDPTDDCTFYYTQEYLVPHNVVSGRWATRVVSFRFPQCGPTRR